MADEVIITAKYKDDTKAGVEKTEKNLKGIERQTKRLTKAPPLLG